MNLRNWGKQHTIGLLIGIATTFVCLFIVMYILAKTDSTTFSDMWRKFKFFSAWQSKIISLAAIGNLIWFHLFMRDQKWNYGMGIIMATVLNLILILLIKFVL